MATVRMTFTSEAYARLRKMATLIGVISEVEVIRNALRLFEWYVQSKADGYNIARTKDGRTFSVVEIDFTPREDIASEPPTSDTLSTEERALLSKVGSHGLPDIRLGPKQRQLADSMVLRGILRKDGITYFPRVAS